VDGEKNRIFAIFASEDVGIMIYFCIFMLCNYDL